MNLTTVARKDGNFAVDVQWKGGSRSLVIRPRAGGGFYVLLPEPLQYEEEVTLVSPPGVDLHILLDTSAHIRVPEF